MLSLSRKIALVSGAGGCGRTTASVDLASLLAKNGKKVLLFDMCFGWGGLDSVVDSLPEFEALLDSNSPAEYVRSLDEGFDILTCQPPEFLDATVDELKKIAWMANELSYQYDVTVFDPPSGAHPLALLAAGMADTVYLFARPDAQSVGTSYCLLKSLYAEGIFSRVKTVFSFVDSPFHAASLKQRFDSITRQFLNFETVDGGYICRRNLSDDGDYSLFEPKNSIEYKSMFHNGTARTGVNRVAPRFIRRDNKQ